MTGHRHITAGLLLTAALGLPPAADAQDDRQPWGIALEIGPLTAEGTRCRFDFSIDNRLTTEINQFEAVLIGRDRLGPLDEIRVNMGPIPSGDHRTQELALTPSDADCGTIQLIEVALQSCEIDGSDRMEGCLALMRSIPRGGRPLIINRNPMPRPAETVERATRSDEAEPTPVPQLGVTIASITEDLAARFSIPAGVEGVVVVAADLSEGETPRLASGDTVLEIDQEVVRNAEDVAERIRSAGSADQSSLLVLILRDGREDFIVVPLSP